MMSFILLFRVMISDSVWCWVLMAPSAIRWASLVVFRASTARFTISWASFSWLSASWRASRAIWDIISDCCPKRWERSRALRRACWPSSSRKRCACARVVPMRSTLASAWDRLLWAAQSASSASHVSWPTLEAVSCTRCMRRTSSSRRSARLLSVPEACFASFHRSFTMTMTSSSFFSKSTLFTIWGFFSMLSSSLARSATLSLCWLTASCTRL
uniref:Uncharacterized protein n=1 Tax=Ixodes ricinus TaxID=34613 RepID=A0A6B0V3N9_IXORI